MKTTIKITLTALMAVFFITSGSIAQNHPDSTKAHQHMMKKDMQNNKMMCDSSKMMNHKGMMNHEKMKGKHDGMMDHGEKMGTGNKMMNNLVHKGVIDVNSIDKNQDGKVYQDMMDWNVISDKPGKCPNCGMKLKEVSIDKAKQNLKKHGYKTK